MQRRGNRVILLSMTKDPSPRFLRFARALALASGVAPLGCGGNTGLRVPANDARPGQADTGSIHDDVGFRPSSDVGAPDDAPFVTIGPPPAGLMGVPALPFDAGADDILVIISNDAGFMGIRPSPPLDGTADAGVDAGDVTDGGLDAAVERYPGGGPPAPPVLPADWWGAGRA
jgi:hypothetical protein